MAQIVKLRRSSVSGQKPTNTNLQLGELALNTADGKVFMAVSGSVGPSVEELITTNTVNTGSINLIGSVSASAFSGSGEGLFNVPFVITGSDVDGINYDKQFTKLHFDSETGLNVSESVPGTAFISIGSHFRDIFVSGSGMLRATGSDAFEVIGSDGIEVTVSNADSNYDGTYSKELKFSALNLSSSLNTRINEITGSLNSFTSSVNSHLQSLDNFTSSVVLTNQTSSMTVLSASYAVTAAFALNAGGSGGAALGSYSLLDQTVASTTWSFAHNVGQRYPIFQIFNSDGDVIIPTQIRTIDENNAEIIFGSAQTGKAIASLGGGNGTTQEFTNSSLWTVNHNLGTDYPDVTVWDSNKKIIIPNTIESVTENQIKIYFSVPTTGHVSVSRGGHIVSGSLSWEGIVNKPSGIVSGSSQLTGAYDARYVLSGSITQTTWDNIANKPNGIVSGSVQVEITGTTGYSTFSSSIATTDLNQDNRLTSLETASGSIRTDFNTFTSSYTTVSGSLDARLDVLETYSGSQQVPTASYAFRTTQTDVYCKNSSGAQIDKGKVVRIVGAVGDNPLIALADYTSELGSANTLGIATENIPNDSFGLVVTEGVLLGVNTTGMNAGQLLFLGTSGSFTTAFPVAPNHGVRLGEVLREQQNNGSIYVRIDNGSELSENHDVTYSGITQGDLLVRNGSGVWVNSKQLNGSYGVTGSLTVSGSMTVFDNLTVYGSSSFVYVTSSQLAVSSSTISVNVFEPAERFGGLKVYDSGSSNATASLLWDSQHNHWVYQNVSGSAYSGGMLISGPRNTGSLGDEPNLTLYKVPVSDGGDHIKDSNITDNGSAVKINSYTEITGSLNVSAGITGDLDFSNIINAPTLVSGSSQINITGTTDYTTFSSSIATTTLNSENRIGSLETASGSIRTDFNSYTSSTDSRLNSIEGVSGSYATTGSNTFNGSQNVIGDVTASLVSSSFKGDGSQLYNIPASGVTGLQLDKIADGSATASISQANGLVVNTNTTITGSVNISGSIYLNGDPVGTGKLDSTEFYTYSSSINTFSSSIDTTIKNKMNSDNVISGSIQVEITGTTGYSTFSSSIATINTNQDNKLYSIESTTSSLLTTTNTLVGKTGSYATTGSNSFIGNEQINGNLSVTGSVVISGSLDISEANLGSSRYLHTQGATSTTWSITHNLGYNYPNVTVYDGATNKIMLPADVTSIDGNTTQVTFATAEYGYALVSVGGITTAAADRFLYTESYSTSSWVIDHNLGYRYPNIDVYDNNDEQLIPQRIKSVSVNRVQIDFAAPTTGHAIITLGGPRSTSIFNQTGSFYNTQYNIGITGSLVVTGDVDAANFNTTSDKKLKTNLERIEGALDKIEKINGYTFNWLQSYNEDDSKQIGMIANEVYEVQPELISKRNVILDGKDEEIMLLDYSKVTALLIEAVKELNDKVKKLENKRKKK